MTRWCAWFKTEDKVPTFVLLIAESIDVAQMIANDLASRDKVKLIGIIRASEQFNQKEVEKLK